MSQQTSPALRITDVRAVTAAGHGVAPALAAVANGVAATQRHDSVAVAASDGVQRRVYYAPTPVAAPDDERCLTLLDALVGDAEEPSLEAADSAWLITPERPLPAGMDSAPDDLVARAGASFGAAVEPASTSAGAMPVLSRLRQAMAAGQFASAWLVAVQSLTDSDTLRALGDERALQAQGTEGLVPGEAAVAIRLAPGEGDGNEPVIRGLASREESARDPQTERLSALAGTIQTACQEAGQDLNAIEACYSDDVGDTDAELEWLQTTNTLWPSQLPEDQRRAVELGLIKSPPIRSPAPLRRHTPSALGHTSVAGALANLALAHRDWHWQQRWHALDAAEAPGARLVTEHPLADHRHAAVLAAD